MAATRLIAVLAAVLIPVLASAQSLVLSRPSLAPDGASLLVNVGGTPRPDQAVVEDEAIWVVSARSPAAPAGQQLAIASAAVTQFFAVTGQVRLTFVTPVAASVTEIDVIAIRGKPTRVTWKRRTPQTATVGIFPAASRAKADVYIGGGWAGGVGTAPLYSLDIAAAAPVREFRAASLPWRASIAGTWKTASSATLDPDTITLAGRIATVFPYAFDETGPYLDLQWDAVKFEFSRRDRASNVVTAPTAVLSHAINWRRADRSVAASLTVDGSLGLELGTNLEDKVAPAGYGAIARIVPGGAAYLVLPGALGLEEIRLTSTYKVRLLATAEPLVDARLDAPVTTIEKGARHEWVDQLSLELTPFVAMTVTHEYGSAPPAFRLLDHRATVGATLMWTWKRCE
jgi:hypothetical protein